MTEQQRAEQWDNMRAESKERVEAQYRNAAEAKSARHRAAYYRGREPEVMWPV
jgi:hypothetical protein